MSIDLDRHSMLGAEDWHQHTLARGRFRARYERRTSKAMMGRFGGGWQWKVGVQACRRTVIVNLLVASIRLDWRDDA